MKPHHLLAAIVFSACAMGAGAQSLKPGLWEITNKMQSGSGQMEQAMSRMQQQLASMPPEQRKMMEEMMARQGMKMGPGGPDGGVIVQVCMTREMAERNEVPTQKGDCKRTLQPRTGNTMKISFTCARPPSSGEGEVTFAGPDAYSMKMTVNTQVQGKPEKMDLAGSGKWLGADCGSIKPLGEAPKK